MTFTVPKHRVAFSWKIQSFHASLSFRFIFTQLNPSKWTEQLKMGWGNVSVMGTCCVYDEYWSICLPLEGKHVWHLVLTLSLLLGRLFFWQRWIRVLFLISSYRMTLVNKASLLGQSIFTFTCFTGTVTVWGELIMNESCSGCSVTETRRPSLVFLFSHLKCQ